MIDIFQRRVHGGAPVAEVDANDTAVTAIADEGVKVIVGVGGDKVLGSRREGDKSAIVVVPNHDASRPQFRAEAISNPSTQNFGIHCPGHKHGCADPVHEQRGYHCVVFPATR